MTTPAPRASGEPAPEFVHGALGCPSRDELAQQDICAELLSTPGLDARHIEVEMTADGVLLRGQVASLDDRARALRITKRIAAPRRVREALTLLPTPEATDAACAVAPRSRPDDCGTHATGASSGLLAASSAADLPRRPPANRRCAALVGPRDAD